jgi:hypothetical protein
MANITIVRTQTVIRGKALQTTNNIQPATIQPASSPHPAFAVGNNYCVGQPHTVGDDVL